MREEEQQTENVEPDRAITNGEGRQRNEPTVWNDSHVLVEDSEERADGSPRCRADEYEQHD